MHKQIFQNKFNKTCFFLLSLVLISIGNTSFAWQHPVHRLAVDISFDSLTKNCRQKFSLNDLTYGSTESDLYRHLLINPSHKHDRWRIEETYKAALKVSNTDPSLADRRIARAFHYILDQSEPLDRLRKKLVDKWKIDSREVGYYVLVRDRNSTQFLVELSRKKIKYSRYKWSEILHEVTLINDKFSKEIRDVLKTEDIRDEAFARIQKALADYFVSTLAMQNHIMHRYCNEKKDEIPGNPRYTCDIKDASAGGSNLCQSWVKESYNRKEVIIVNEEAWAAGWRPPRGYKKHRFNECTIVKQDAQDGCTSWMNTKNEVRPRNICNVIDLSKGESNLCHVYTKWLRGPLDNYLVGVCVVNEQTVIDGWIPPAEYTHSRFNECKSLLPQAMIDCEISNTKGLPSNMQLD